MKKNNVNSSPLKSKVCACGCETEFLPNRSNHDYLNSKHYNYAYNHGPRKEKYAEEIDVIKRIRKNDRILMKYFQSSDREVVSINHTILKADGFDSSFFTSINDVKEEKYYILFEYSFKIVKQGTVTYITIRKN